jgi:hypothetical protein
VSTDAGHAGDRADKREYLFNFLDWDYLAEVGFLLPAGNNSGNQTPYKLGRLVKAVKILYTFRDLVGI